MSHATSVLYEALLRAIEPATKDKERTMAMLKVIEVLAESNKSWEDAAQQAVTKASKSVHNVKSIYIKNFEATVEKAKLKSYRVNAKISFVLD
jgi:flavin-binding protein dodecin